MSNVIQFKIIPKQQNQKSILLKSKMWESLTLPDLDSAYPSQHLCLTRSINISDFMVYVVHFSFSHIVM